MKKSLLILSIILISALSLLFSERGDLISYELSDDIDKETAQAVLNAFIPTAPNVIYDLEMYSITYETIDQFGNEAIASGAIVMGKTATSELAYLGPPATTNPHDKTRTPGGSSSGSAASVASFMAPASIGSQTGGSVIRPASYCGVVGYKPSYGLISRNGVLRTSYSLDQIGMFGRKVEDVAMLAKVLIKKDKYDSATIHYSTENILSETKKGPLFEPKFIFYKTSQHF
mgnify:CR=1 FL=1